MSLECWLKGIGPKPGYKRKADESLEASPAKKKFTKENNQKDFSWYVRDSEGKWHCQICRDARVDSAYAVGHDAPAKTTNHARHAASQTHLNAVTKVKLAAAQPMKKIVEERIKSDNDAAYGYMWAAYQLGKRELQKEEFVHLLDLIELGGKDLKRTSTVNYSSNQSISEFQEAISETILERKLSAIQDSEYFSITTDESTDVGNRKRLLVYAQYMDLTAMELEWCLLNNIEINEGSATASVIVDKITNELKQKGLDITKLVGIGTDGAKVMTGIKGGVVTKLKSTCPALVSIHCAAHRCALAVSQAAKGIPEMEWYSRSVGNIFRFFSNSALRENKLREIQNLLELPELKYADLHSVRWLSLENAVQIIYRTYPALVMTLSHIAATDVSAKKLCEEVQQYKFVALTHLLMDILPFIGRLNTTLQSDSLDFSKVAPMVESTIESLKDLTECEGAFVDKLVDFVCEDDNGVKYRRPVSESKCSSIREAKKDNHEFSGFSDSECEVINDSETVNEVDITYYTQQKGVVQKITNQYVTAIVENLDSRFGDRGLLHKMDCLLPTSILTNKKAGKSFGESDIKSLAEHYTQQIPTLSIEQCIDEYKQYKNLASTDVYKDNSVVQMVCIMNMKFKKEYPNLCVILVLCSDSNDNCQM